MNARRALRALLRLGLAALLVTLLGCQLPPTRSPGAATDTEATAGPTVEDRLYVEADRIQSAETAEDLRSIVNGCIWAVEESATAADRARAASIAEEAVLAAASIDCQGKVFPGKSLALPRELERAGESSSPIQALRDLAGLRAVWPNRTRGSAGVLRARKMLLSLASVYAKGLASHASRELSWVALMRRRGRSGEVDQPWRSAYTAEVPYVRSLLPRLGQARDVRDLFAKLEAAERLDRRWPSSSRTESEWLGDTLVRRSYWSEEALQDTAEQARELLSMAREAQAMLRRLR